MKKKLTIEEWKPENEVSVKWVNMGYYWDIKTHIEVQKKRISKDLIVGKKYDFTFEDDNDVDTYTYLILKKEESDIYYMIEFYNTPYCVKESCLGDVWNKCDVYETLGIDLENIKL